MPREAETSNNEKTFILDALVEKHRLDGRSFDQFRDLSISFGEAFGSVTVQLGRTRYETALQKAHYRAKKGPESTFSFQQKL